MNFDLVSKVGLYVTRLVGTTDFNANNCSDALSSNEWGHQTQAIGRELNLKMNEIDLVNKVRRPKNVGKIANLWYLDLGRSADRKLAFIDNEI